MLNVINISFNFISYSTLYRQKFLNCLFRLGYSSMVEHLLGMFKVLDSIPSTT